MLVQPGERIAGRFEIESLAGTGGMGAVYRARDLQTGERVALKLLRHDAQHRERFLREARLLAGMQHPGIVRYVDSGETPEGAPFLAMEWLEGETLDARLARAELTLAESVAMVRGVAEALGAAHARGVVHRDVKPANVFLVGASPERPRLLDFGIARELVGVASLTGTGAVLGSLGYMSPEQVRGERALDARSDVFSLGLLLYRCVARQPAFAADHPLALLAMVVFHDPTPLLDRRPEAPPALDALSRRMLSRRRELRPADGAEVARALGELGAHTEGDGPARSAALTGRERRLVGVVLARVAERSLDRDATLLLPAAGAVPALVGGLRLDSSEFAWLADDTLVVVLTAAGAATDLATRAARTALALRAEHPGAALVVATGSAEVGASLPSGEVLDRAAALLAASPASPSPEEAIALDPLTAELLRARFEVRTTPRGALLAGEGSADPARPAGAPGALPFVGRERELSQLLSLYDATVAEPVAQAVLVTAPAGVGKSRLAAEMLSRLPSSAEPPEVWRAYGDPMSGASPLALVASCVRRVAGILDGEALGARQEKLRAAVAARVPEPGRERVTEFLGELVRAPFPDEGRPTLRQARQHAPLLADEIRRAFEELVAGASAQRPLVIVAEDVHWADAPSLSYLDGALRRLPQRPLFVLALARPEVHSISPQLWAERHVLEMRLRGLRAVAAAALVRAALGADVRDSVAGRLVEQADGNAFYLEEMVRAVAEGLTAAPPDTVIATVQVRLGALPSPARAVLRAASVFGEVFWQGSVEALLGADAATVPTWLAHLVARDVLVSHDDARFPGEREYAFRHALLRDGADALLTDDDRAVGHRLAAAWLEAAGETDAAVLAGHYDRGREPETAARWWLSAAEQAFERDDLDAALDLAHRAATLDPSAPARVEAAVSARRAELAAGASPVPAAVPASAYRFAVVPGTQIFTEVCEGCWSREFTLRYVADFKAAVAPLLGRPWGKLCDLDAWLPTAPDAAETIIDFLKWSIAQGMVSVAYVIGNPDARLQARRIIEASRVDVRCDFFASEAEGLAWLRRNGLG